MIAQEPGSPPNPLGVGLTILFVAGYVGFFLLMFGGLALAVAALVSAGRRPAEAFGPWWDNTKTAWLLGIAAGFLIPCGAGVTGGYWFFHGRRELGRTGFAPRPFWVGPPKPPPYLPMPPTPLPPQPPPA